MNSEAMRGSVAADLDEIHGMLELFNKGHDGKGRFASGGGGGGAAKQKGVDKWGYSKSRSMTKSHRAKLNAYESGLVKKKTAGSSTVAKHYAAKKASLAKLSPVDRKARLGKWKKDAG